MQTQKRQPSREPKPITGSQLKKVFHEGENDQL